MLSDIRESPLYREMEALYRAVRQPGTGQISDAADLHASPDGKQVVFAGTLVDALEGVPATRICITDLATGDTRVVTSGANVDRLPKFGPGGRWIAFLSDRHEAGDFQLYLLNPWTGAVRSTPKVPGWVEHLQWSPDGQRILLGVAGHGAELSGGQGAVTSRRAVAKVPSWMPAVETGAEIHRWRRAWIYEMAADQVRQVSEAGANIWEAVWCGNEALAAVVSPGPEEGLWYSAHLRIIDRATGDSNARYCPEHQIGCPAASPSGNVVAFVEAICSDRGFVAGRLLLMERAGGEIRRVETGGVDITYTEWRSDRHLLLAGHRGFETVVGLYDAESDTFADVWSDEKLTVGGYYAAVSGCNAPADCVLVGESFTRTPEIAVIRQGKYRTVKSFDLGYQAEAEIIGAAEPIRWSGTDGLEIQGWLLRPKGVGPRPLVMHVHGGPVYHWRPLWLGRRTMHLLMLIRRGYSVLLPNPRGSSGRGEEFVRPVLGDIGGADADDLLSGIDSLVERGIADPKRLGVTGVSYGGFMTAWLITQDTRFAAAVSVAPITNQVTGHLLSNIPQFSSLFLGDSYLDPRGKYVQRSPIMHAHKATTPTLNICGALDRCTPPEEAAQFHSALLEHQVESVLVTYPKEGHGIRNLPAAIDFATRLVAWFEDHLGPRREEVGGST